MLSCCCLDTQRFMTAWVYTVMPGRRGEDRVQEGRGRARGSWARSKAQVLAAPSNPCSLCVSRTGLSSLMGLPHGSTTDATSLCLLRRLPGGREVSRSAGAECTIYANPRPISVSPSSSPLLSEVFLSVTLQTGCCTGPSGTGGLPTPVCFPPAVLASVLAEPVSGESGLFSLHLAGESSPHLFPGTTGKQVLPPCATHPHDHRVLHSSFPSHLLPPNPSCPRPPKSLRFLLFEMWPYDYFLEADRPPCPIPTNVTEDRAPASPWAALGTKVFRRSNGLLAFPMGKTKAWVLQGTAASARSLL